MKYFLCVSEGTTIVKAYAAWEARALYFDAHRSLPYYVEEVFEDDLDLYDCKISTDNLGEVNV